MLALLVRSALEVARETDGDVDPTLGFALEAAGYDRDISLIEDSNSILRAVISPRPGWKSVELNGLHLRLPAHLSFDLGASAKAVAADLVAAAITAQTGSGVLVSLGGDIATAGKAPEEGWNILVQDLPTDPESSVRLSAGFGMATSSTQKRRWERGGVTVHHILDPRTGLPAEPVWRSVTVSAPSCLHANALSTASIIRGEAAIAWLGSMNVAARLVRGNGDVITIGGWPEEKANPDNQEVPSNV
jgi:thiamine biosynthesis lipoprotein